LSDEAVKQTGQQGAAQAVPEMIGVHIERIDFRHKTQLGVARRPARAKTDHARVFVDRDKNLFQAPPALAWCFQPPLPARGQAFLRQAHQHGGRQHPGIGFAPGLNVNAGNPRRVLCPCPANAYYHRPSPLPVEGAGGLTGKTPCASVLLV